MAQACIFFSMQVPFNKSSSVGTVLPQDDFQFYFKHLLLVDAISIKYRNTRWHNKLCTSEGKSVGATTESCCC